MNGGWCSIVICALRPIVPRAIAIASASDARGLPAHDLGHRRVVGADDDHAADLLAAALAPVPHEERVRAVVRVAAPVHLDVARVVGELVLVLLLERVRVAGLGQEPVEELDVARVVHRIELVRARVRDDHDAAVAQERLVPVHVIEVAERHHLHEQRVERLRVHVVRRDVRDAGDQDVGLALDLDAVLLVAASRASCRASARTRRRSSR